MRSRTNLRSREDDVTWKQRRALAQEGNGLLYTENHVGGAAFLYQLWVEM